MNLNKFSEKLIEIINIGLWIFYLIRIYIHINQDTMDSKYQVLKLLFIAKSLNECNRELLYKLNKDPV